MMKDAERFPKPAAKPAPRPAPKKQPVLARKSSRDNMVSDGTRGAA